MAAKNFSREIHNKCEVWLEATYRPRKFLSPKSCFWAEIGKTAKYLILKNFRLYSTPGLFCSFTEQYYFVRMVKDILMAFLLYDECTLHVILFVPELSLHSVNHVCVL